MYSIIQGYAFIYMEDDMEAEDAIRALDRYEFGRKGRRLRVEWTKNDRRGAGGSGGLRRSSSSIRPSNTLFVVNFDAQSTRTRDLERHFEPYGKILNVRISRNFGFIEFESQEDATRALDATNSSKLMDKIITVEYAKKNDDARRNRYSPERRYDRFPDRRRASPRSYGRERGSPDYGRGRRSPSPYKRARPSPDYKRDDRKRERVSLLPYIEMVDSKRDVVASPDHRMSYRKREVVASPEKRAVRNQSPDQSRGRPPYEKKRSRSRSRSRSKSSPEHGEIESPGQIMEEEEAGRGYNGAESPVRKSHSTAEED